MEQKRIKCPKCGSVLKFSYENNGDAVKRVTCPVCKTGLKINLAPQTKNVAPPQPQKDGGETVLVTAPSAPSGTFVITFNGQSFPLKKGVNTIGRQAFSSTASLQIPTSDSFLSRSHVTINVLTDALGNSYATLQNHQNTNETLINNVEINQDDVIKLNNGDHITMGETTIVFESK